MDKPILVTVDGRAWGNIFRKEERLLTVTDEKLEFSTLLGGKWPEDWNRKDITIKKDRLNLAYRVSFNNPGTKRQVLSTYTKSIYKKRLLPVVLIGYPLVFVLSTITLNDTQRSRFFPIIILVAILPAIGINYLPYSRLGKELEEHGYLN